MTIIIIITIIIIDIIELIVIIITIIYCGIMYAEYPQSVYAKHTGQACNAVEQAHPGHISLCSLAKHAGACCCKRDGQLAWCSMQSMHSVPDKHEMQHCRGSIILCNCNHDNGCLGCASCTTATGQGRAGHIQYSSEKNRCDPNVSCRFGAANPEVKEEPHWSML